MPATFLPPPPPWLAQTLSNMQPPDWLLHELELKGVLAINHVLLANPDALPRTRRLSGQSVQLRWQKWAFQWIFTPAGLLERVDVRPSADLVLNLGEIAPWEVVNTVLRGERPALRIEGDVQLAAEINWLADHVRWNPQEDLARLLGDAQAQALVLLARKVADGLRRFVRAASARAGGPA